MALYSKVQKPEIDLRVGRALSTFFKGWNDARTLVDKFEISLRAEKTKVMRLFGAKENMKAFTQMSRDYRKALQEFFDSTIITIVSNVMDRVRRDGIVLRPDISPLDLE